MFAFLFDEDHPDMPFIFGPTCASFIVRTLEGIAECHLLVGSLLHSSLAYSLEELEYTKPKSEGSGIIYGGTKHKMTADINLFKSIICDLAEALACPIPAMSEDDLLSILGKKNIWLVVASGISWEHAKSVHQGALSFSPYLGFVGPDVENPVHRHLFIESRFTGRYLSKNGLLFHNEQSGAGEFAEDYGAKNYRVLEAEEYHQLVPALNYSTVVSERGRLSLERMQGSLTTHRKRVADALVKYRDVPRDYRFVLKSTDWTEPDFAVDEAKFTKYLLDPEHPTGGPKARFFTETLGIAPSDWRYLADQLVQGAALAELYRVQVTSWEFTHGAIVRVTGRNGKTVLVETGWKLAEEGPAFLVTAYPYAGEERPSIPPVTSRVPPLGLSSDDRFQSIFEIASREGLKAGTAVIPPPMVLKEYGTIWEGECGFAWVHLPDARTPFARWLSKRDIGYPGRPGRIVFSSLKTQSVVRNRAFATAFANTLRINGIECSVNSRLD